MTTTHNRFSCFIASIGFIVIIAAVFILVYNEQHAGKKYRSLHESQLIAKSVPIDKINPKNNNKLIQISGLATTTKALKDPYFNLTLKHTLKYQREVQIYQWKETIIDSKKAGVTSLGNNEYQIENTKNYKYSKTWSSRLINSKKFAQKNKQYTNPRPKIRTLNLTASPITIGKFTLAPVFVNQITKNWEPIVVKLQSSSSLNQKFKLVGNTFYSGNPKKPKIGDIRIELKRIKSQSISLIGQQKGSTIRSFPKNKQVPDGPVALLSYGKLSMSQELTLGLYQAGIPWNNRLIGIGIMLIGVFLLLIPFYKYIKTSPNFTAVRYTSITLYLLFIIAITLLLSALCIAFYWKFLHTLLSLIILLLVILVLLAFIFNPRKNKKSDSSKKSE